MKKHQNLLRPSSLFGVLKEVILGHCWHHYNGFAQCEPKKSDIYHIQITAQCNTIVGKHCIQSCFLRVLRFPPSIKLISTL